MGLFRKKRKKALFGANVEPSCSYCQHNGGRGEGILCTVQCQMKEGACKKYLYDPLRREPRGSSLLKAEQYSEEDFKL